MSLAPQTAIARRWVLALYCLSGFLSLGYQVVWFRLFADRYGATPFTFGLVVICFIGGLGLGSWQSQRLCGWLSGLSPLRARKPLQIYGLVELLVTAGLFLTFGFQFLALPPAGADAYTFPHSIEGGLQVWRLGFGWKIAMATAAIFVLTVPCFFMGASFPLLCSIFQSDARFPSEIYAWNTLGACLGVVACEFVLLAHFGHHFTMAALVGCNAALGAIFLFGSPGQLKIDQTRERSAQPAKEDGGTQLGLTTAFALAGLSGLIAGALEADLFQQIRFSGYVLSAAMSFVSFWAILAIFLGSLTVRSLPRLKLNGLKLAALAAPFIYAVTVNFRYELRNGIAKAFLPYTLEAPSVRIPHYMDAGLTPVFLLGGVFVFPAFYLISLILPHVCNRLQAAGHTLGRAYAVNTIAFCVGLFGFSFTAPRVDIFYGFKLFLFVFVIGAGTVAVLKPQEDNTPRKLALGLVAIAVAIGLTPRGFDIRFFDPVTASKITEVRALRSNGAATTYVVADSAYPGERLYFDGYSMSGTAPGDQQYMRLMAHFPLLAQPHPTKALQIGFGVGSTASAVASHDTIQRFDIVDLNHQVLATASEFAGNNREVLKDPRVRMFHDDGRTFLRLTQDNYDLVTSEPPPPIFEGVYRLYSKEYYELVLKRLTSNGMMTQWLPMNQLSQESSAWIARTFVQTFPHSLAFIGYADHVILVGAKQPISLRMLERRMLATPAMGPVMTGFGIRSPGHLLARIIADDSSLRTDYGDGPVIHDARNQFAHLIHRDTQPKLNFRPAQLLAGMADLEYSLELFRIWSSQAEIAKIAPDYPFWLIQLAEE